MKKIFGILLAIGFILTMTAGAVSAGGDRDHYGDHDERGGHNEHRGGHNAHFGEHQHGEHHHHHHHEWRNNRWEDWDEDCWC